MYGYIYKTTNLINEQIYIGQKKSSIFLENKYLGSGKYLKCALNKYGKENFKVELLEWCSDKVILNEREIYWINYYKSNNYKMYNISKGGDGGNTYLYLSPSEREIRCKKTSEKCYFKHCTDKDRQKAWNTRRKNHKDKPTKQQLDKRIKSLKEFYQTEEGLKLRQRVSQRNIKKGLITKQKFLMEWYSQPRYCKTCGKLMTTIYGKGVYCCKSCSVTHKHNEQTKQLLRNYNLKGICGNKGKHLSQQHKQALSQSHKGKNVGKKFYTDGIKTICIYDSPPKGFKPGRAPRNKPAWNKGKKWNRVTKKYE